MRIAAIDYMTGSRVVSYEETLDLLRYYTSRVMSGPALEETLRTADKLLQIAGFKQCVVRGEKQPFYAEFLDLARATIEKAGLKPNDIDMVIYHAVGRGYKEPATAVQIAARLGIKHPESFDIIDACSGWARTTRITEQLLRASYARNVLVLGLEFNRSPMFRLDVSKQDHFNKIYSLQNAKELDWRIWGATVGEAGQVTVLSKDDAKGPWYWDYINVPEEYQDCALPLKNHREWDIEEMPLEGVHEEPGDFFWAFGKNIGDSTRKYVSELLLRVPEFLREASVVVPHSLSANVYAPIFEKIGVSAKAIYPYREYGNCVSCGVPIALAMAIKQGLLKRGERVVAAPVGAGASYGVTSFIY